MEGDGEGPVLPDGGRPEDATATPSWERLANFRRTNCGSLHDLFNPPVALTECAALVKARFAVAQGG